jgi:2-keto-4-pentenoate hydratase/2-oxohepta-3-ene-1,7-dioic acid hydratase in catechol pathway
MMKLEPWLTDIQPWMERKDMDAFMVVNPWVKTDVEMEVI